MNTKSNSCRARSVEGYLAGSLNSSLIVFVRASTGLPICFMCSTQLRSYERRDTFFFYYCSFIFMNCWAVRFRDSCPAARLCLFQLYSEK